ncbi:MAG: GYD domain-containing protein [Deltaproteobacteria bacterium]|nr:GYD domain-containing protein [Deltaproteobacteria bacterium]
MPTFIILANFTEQGIKTVTQTTERAKAFEAMAAELGVRLNEIYWTMGRYDVVAVVEAPDDETMSAVTLGLGVRGNVRTETLRAYSASDMARIFRKMGGGKQ